jgi:hypothetical protein
MAALNASPLAVGFIRARSLAALGFADSALVALESIATAPPDPALQSGLTGRLNPVPMITPGWAMVQVALELAAHGEDAAAGSAARRAITWWEERERAGGLAAEGRLVLASALAFDGQLDAAQAILADLVENDTTSVEFRGALGVVAAALAERALASRAETWLAGQNGVFPPGLPVLYQARIAAARGDTARARALIQDLPHGVHPLDFLQFHIDPALKTLSGAPWSRRIELQDGPE